MGHKIESLEKTEPTVATICGVSGKTIRTRLKRARARLSQIMTEDT
jgi:DNA-directed RNA polymerase specialized sigma24 family protein